MAARFRRRAALASTRRHGLPSSLRREGRSLALIRAFVVLGSLLVLALMAAVIAPFFIDWTAYRADFEREASRIVGRPVVVHGDASARLLPFPSVTFTNVAVEGAGDVPLMTIDRFRMDAELAPYLSGEIRIYSMTVERPRVRVPVSEAGRVDWVVGQPSFHTAATVVLENVAITDGSVLIENGLTGRSHVLSNVNATLSARSLVGPIAGFGSFVADGEALRFSISSGEAQPDGALPLKLDVASDRLDGSVTFDGAARVAEGQPHLAGTLQVQRPPAAMLTGSPGPTGTADTAASGADAADEQTPVHMTSAVAATVTAAELSEMRVTVGKGTAPYAMTGAGTLDFGKNPHFTLDLQGEQVDVNTLAAPGTEETGLASSQGAPAVPPTDVTPGAADTPKPSFAERLEATRRVLAAIPQPPLPGTATIKLPVVVAGDTTIRDVGFVVSPGAAGAWTVKDFAAELPGRTRIEASGDVFPSTALRFAGDLLLASRQPSGFADWLTGSVDPAIRTLPRAGFSAKVDLSAAAQRFDELEVDVGGQGLKGHLARSAESGHRLVDAELSGGAIDLDALLALSRLFTGAGESVASADRLRLKLKAGPIRSGDAAAARVDADLAYDGATLSIERLDIGDLAGANLSTAGRLTGLDQSAEGALTFKLDAERPQPLFTLLRDRLPEVPIVAALAERSDRLGPLAVSGEVKTAPGEAGAKPTLMLRLAGRADGTAIKLTSALENGLYGASESGRFGAELTLTNDEPGVLLAQLGLETLPVDAPAPLTAALSLSAAATGPVAASASLRAPGTDISADGTLDIEPAGLVGADLSVAIRSTDLSPFLLMTAVSLGQSFESLPVEAAARLSWFKDDWTLQDLSGDIAGTRVAADLARTGGGAIGGSVTLSDLSMPWLATLVYGRAPLDDAAGLWPEEAFLPSLLPDVEYGVDLKADRLWLGTGPEAAGVSARVSGAGDRLSIEALSARIATGTVEGSAAFRNAAGIGSASLKLNLAGIDLATLWPAAAPGETAPAGTGLNGTLAATVAIDASGQSYAGLASASVGAGRVELTDTELPGLAEGLFPSILAAADAEGFDASEPNASALVKRLSAGRRYGPLDFGADFALTGGVARFTPTAIARPGEMLTVGGSLDLADLDAEADLSLAFDPGDEAVEGAVPAVTYALRGSAAAPSLTISAEPLANYLSVRALEREQARVEAMQEALQEKLRLRREARLYRSRAEEFSRAAAANAAEEAEQMRLERQRREDAERQARLEEEARAAAAAAAAEAERAAAERAAAERAERAAAERRREAEAAAAQRSRAPTPATPASPQISPTERPAVAQPPTTPRPEPDFGAPVAGPDAPATTPAPDFPSLPGVNDPLRF
ncbi:AsmA family protein [Mangrovicella endophytica]|uniref:AsmA family protein n=1 Tax=Mangrovicella endophytica TaxID=2066697 RepID=UPI000C9DB9F7|nr:AsmA family protein [Mangrovicella endophytica]